MSRAPPRARGLKHNNVRALVGKHSRAPPRARGLKLSLMLCRPTAQVAPPRGRVD